MTATVIPFVSLVTDNGLYYFTAVNAGGLGGPNVGPQAVALHTDASRVGGWETFEVIFQFGSGPVLDTRSTFALRTFNGNFVTAVNGGGIGGPNDNTCPIHTDAKQVGDWETFSLALDTSSNPATATFQTAGGQFLTAVNGGGIGGPINPPPPVITTAKAVTGTEIFRISTPYDHFVISFVDRATNNPILDAVCEAANPPFVYGPILEGNSYVVGLKGDTNMTWTAEGYNTVNFTVEPGGENGLFITIHLDYAVPVN